MGLADALTNVAPADTYGDLLHLSNDGDGADATMRKMYDGLGSGSGLWISTAGVGATRLIIGAGGPMLVNASGAISARNSGDTAPAAILTDQLLLQERSSDPSDPADGYSIMWQSDGTETGEDGELWVKSTTGAGTATRRLMYGAEQPHIADPAGGGACVYTALRLVVNDIIDALEAWGITATS